MLISELPNTPVIDDGRGAKLILENKTDLPMIDFLRLAQEVVKLGRISKDGKQYCYAVSFTIDGQQYHIISELNKKSDKLTFIKNATETQTKHKQPC
jgi:hypothetical protein